MFIIVLFVIFLASAITLYVGYSIGHHYGTEAERTKWEEAREQEIRDRLLIDMDDKLKGLRESQPDDTFSFESSSVRRQSNGVKNG